MAIRFGVSSILVIVVLSLQGRVTEANHCGHKNCSDCIAAAGCKFCYPAGDPFEWSCEPESWGCGGNCSAPGLCPAPDSDGCRGYKDCSNCTSDPGCGWSLYEHGCFPAGVDDVPCTYDGACDGGASKKEKNWYWVKPGSDRCPKVDGCGYKNCTSCVADPMCGWGVSFGGCYVGNVDGACDADDNWSCSGGANKKNGYTWQAGANAVCPRNGRSCGDYQDCRSCTSDPACGWADACHQGNEFGICAGDDGYGPWHYGPSSCSAPTPAPQHPQRCAPGRYPYPGCELKNLAMQGCENLAGNTWDKVTDLFMKENCDDLGDLVFDECADAAAGDVLDAGILLGPEAFLGAALVSGAFCTLGSVSAAYECGAGVSKVNHHFVGGAIHSLCNHAVGFLEDVAHDFFSPPTNSKARLSSPFGHVMREGGASALRRRHHVESDGHSTYQLVPIGFETQTEASVNLTVSTTSASTGLPTGKNRTLSFVMGLHRSAGAWYQRQTYDSGLKNGSIFSAVQGSRIQYSQGTNDGSSASVRPCSVLWNATSCKAVFTEESGMAKGNYTHLPRNLLTLFLGLFNVTRSAGSNNSLEQELHFSLNFTDNATGKNLTVFQARSSAAPPGAQLLYTEHRHSPTQATPISLQLVKASGATMTMKFISVSDFDPTSKSWAPPEYCPTPVAPCGFSCDNDAWLRCPNASLGFLATPSSRVNSTNKHPSWTPGQCLASFTFASGCPASAPYCTPRGDDESGDGHPPCVPFGSVCNAQKVNQTYGCPIDRPCCVVGNATCAKAPCSANSPQGVLLPLASNSSYV